MSLDAYQQELTRLSEASRLRRRRVIADGVAAQCEIDGQRVVNFSSNNYLGLAEDPRLKAAAIEATERYGTGSGASRLISGTSPLVTKLEEALASFKQAEAALVLNSGYQGNVAILQGLLGPGDWVFSDRLNHASLIDGCLLSGAKWTRYTHLDLENLETRLRKAPADAKKWIITDTVFSMDGDYGDLWALVELAERYGALILVDEAHATGIFGHQRASGLCEQFGVSDRIALQMGTFSKALGGFGAYVAGSKVLIETLVNKARGFIYSTALPPAVIGAALKAIDVVQTDPSMKERLWDNCHHFQQHLIGHGIESRTQSQIFPIIIGDAGEAVRISQQLLEAGYYVQAIRPPTVPEGTARLRIAVSALHTPEHLEGLASALATAFRNTSLPGRG